MCVCVCYLDWWGLMAYQPLFNANSFINIGIKYMISKHIL